MNMKQVYLFCIFTVALFLIGCGSGKVYVCADGSEVSDASLCASETAEEVPSEEAVAEESAVEESAEEVEVQDYTLSDSEKALLDTRMQANTRAALSTPLVKNLNVGDVYVAALGIQNIIGDHEFVVTIKFREAKDYSGSILETNDELIQAWMSKNLYTTYTLERSEELVLPLIIEVGATITDAGGPTLPGTYIYDVYVDYITNSGNTDEYEKLLLTVQIAE
ncbi:hypothetical protein HZC31_06460 [Candidatus Woesearchaeota archaeon]|nr:hypothetical protein [Candidatus Woesearchaeota archaeon]